MQTYPEAFPSAPYCILIRPALPLDIEAVTKEDGSIWALPVAVNIPGLIVHEGNLAELGVPLKRDITWEEFLPMFAALPEEQKKLTSINLIVSTIAFSQQYFQRYESVDNEIFRRTAELMKLLDPNQGLNSIEDSERYLFDYERNMSTYIDDYKSYRSALKVPSSADNPVKNGLPFFISQAV